MGNLALRMSVPASDRALRVGALDALDAPTGRASIEAALARLIVVHIPRPIAEPRPTAEGSDFGIHTSAQVLSIRTCQREVHLTVSADAPSAASAGTMSAGVMLSAAMLSAAMPVVHQLHRGAAAYRFLIEFASGLESAIPGETNVFGQVREAWRAFRDAQLQAARALEPLVEAWFRDVRLVRTRFLQGIGGDSYATLARRLLAPGSDARVLIVGFGELGRTMPAKFARHDVAVFERTASLPAWPELRRFGPGEEREAAQWATHVVMCVPRNEDTDARWVAALRARGELRVVHLGARRDEADAWAGFADFFDLDHVFDLQRVQTARRAARLQAARAACGELARVGDAVSGALL